MNPKLLIVLVVLLIILFVVGTGAGIANGNKSPSLDQPWVAFFGDLLTPHVGINDISVNPQPPNPVGCVVDQSAKNFTVPQFATCTYTINSSSRDVRRLVLRLLGEGFSAAVGLNQTDPVTQSPDVQTASGTVSAGKADIVLNDLKVYKDGANLAIQCLSASPCKLRLE